MKLVNVKILALLVITYSIALIAMTPLSWLLPLVENQLTPMGVRVSQVEGSIWQGQGQISERTLGEAKVQWDIQLLPLLLLKAPIDLRITNSHADLNGTVAVSPFGVSVTGLSGHIDEKAFQSVYQPYRADISGRLQLNGVSADVSWGRKLGDASGELSWSGGPISFPVGRSIQSYEVPTMLGQLTSDENQWLVDIKGQQDQQFIQANLTREGMGTLSIKRNLATEMKIPIPGGGSSLFEVSQQVL
jgi:hypothetical protein